ncbi:MAG TPA: hypothetical protein GXZ24_04180 [Firmicutes bacterium]|nr:hypothetical protein [Bacillota bacterium]
MKNKGVHIPFLPQRTEPILPAKKSSALPAGKSSPFERVLGEAIAGNKLSFSAHARQRLESRSISFDNEELGKLGRAVDKAAAKGCRSSLLIYRDMALVAGVPTRTIITALDGKSMKEHVFTNIDSALIVE